MCNYTILRCTTCHTTISTSAINCGKGLAILGPSGMTIECPVFATAGIREIIEETHECDGCVRHANFGGRRESEWETFLAWRRSRGS